MTTPKTTTTTSLYPRYDTVQEVYTEAKANLPIKSENELIALLKLHGNTLIYSHLSEKSDG